MDLSSAPRVPSKRARALIFRFQGRQSVFLYGALIAILVCAFMGLTVFRGTLDDLALSFAKRETTGKVIEAALDKNSSVNHEHPTVIRFRYQVGAEQLEGESSTIDSAIVAASKPGSEVHVEYSASDRTRARIRGTTFSIFGPWMALNLIFPAVVFVLAALAVRDNRRARRAFTIGKPAIARVLFAGLDSRVSTNDRHPFRIEWELSVDGRGYRGAISSWRQELLGELMTQKELIVLYDPANPRINTAFV